MACQEDLKEWKNHWDEVAGILIEYATVGDTTTAIRAVHDLIKIDEDALGIITKCWEELHPV